MTQEEADSAQAWKGMDGATAWHLIDRHADGWNDVGEMMNAWLRANTQIKESDLLRAVAERNIEAMQLLRAAAPHVYASAEAEHLTDGFKPRIHAIDDLVAKIKTLLGE